MKKIDVLGAEYEICTHKISEDNTLKQNHWAGYCNEFTKQIVLSDFTEQEFFPDMTENEIEAYKKSILRHEIVHAFLNESGLSANTLQVSEAWAKNEEMVDWIAIQFPKILEAFKSVNAL